MSLQVNLLRLSAGINGTFSVLHMFFPSAFYRAMYPASPSPQADNLHRDLQRMWGSYELGMAVVCLGASISPSAALQRLALGAMSITALVMAAWLHLLFDSILILKISIITFLNIFTSTAGEVVARYCLS